MEISHEKYLLFQPPYCKTKQHKLTEEIHVIILNSIAIGADTHGTCPFSVYIILYAVFMIKEFDVSKCFMFIKLYHTFHQP